MRCNRYITQYVFAGVGSWIVSFIRKNTVFNSLLHILRFFLNTSNTIVVLVSSIVPGRGWVHPDGTVSIVQCPHSVCMFLVCVCTVDTYLLVHSSPVVPTSS
jgi:hypothetical protein